MLKAYKYKILPNDEQIVLLNKHFGSARFIYNLALETKALAWSGNKVNLSYFDLSKQIPDLKNEYDWLKEINSQSLQYCLKNLETAYKNFFRFKKGFPRFKSKKDNHHSFCVPQNVSVIGDLLFIRKFKDGIKFIKHREFNGKIKQ